VPAVEELSVRSAQLLHAGREAAAGGVDDEVVVVTEEAEGQDTPAVSRDGGREDAEERDAVDVVLEDLASRSGRGR